MSSERLPPLPTEQWTEQQHSCAMEIINGPRGALISPFVPLLRSPELMRHAQAMGEYLRYRSALGQRLSELAILVTARRWAQQVEWAIHQPIALHNGISSEAVNAIAQGRRPTNMPPDEVLVHDFCVELHSHRCVSDATWSQAVEQFGEQAVVDLIAVNGYYTLLSMVMNAARTAVPPSSAPLLPVLPA